MVSGFGYKNGRFRRCTFLTRMTFVLKANQYDSNVRKAIPCTQSMLYGTALEKPQVCIVFMPWLSE